MTVPRLISIIMVTHKTGSQLYRSLASVLAQEEKLELILVNNGNPEEVEATLMEKFKDVPHVRMMTGHGDIGITKARNFGARVASGDYLLFLDDTCILPKNALSLLYEEAQTRIEPYILGARLVDEKGQEKRGSRLALLTPLVAFVNHLFLGAMFPKFRLWLHKQVLTNDTLTVPALGGAFLFGSKQTFASLYGMNEQYFAELASMDLCDRITQDGGIVGFMPELTVQQEEKAVRFFDMEAEKGRLKAFCHYFSERYGDSYPQPVLWLLYLIYAWIFILRVATRRKSVVL